MKPDSSLLISQTISKAMFAILLKICSKMLHFVQLSAVKKLHWHEKFTNKIPICITY